MSDVLLPHPVTGQPFPSPVPPGTGWPEDPAAPDTPVARTAAQVRRLAADPGLAEPVARYLAHERTLVAEDIAEQAEEGPFRKG